MIFFVLGANRRGVAQVAREPKSKRWSDFLKINGDKPIPFLKGIYGFNTDHICSLNTTAAQQSAGSTILKCVRQSSPLIPLVASLSKPRTKALRK